MNAAQYETSVMTDIRNRLLEEVGRHGPESLTEKCKFLIDRGTPYNEIRLSAVYMRQVIRDLKAERNPSK